MALAVLADMTITPAVVLSSWPRLLLLVLGLGAAVIWTMRRPPTPAAVCHATSGTAIAQVQPLHYRISRGQFMRLFDEPSPPIRASYRVVPAISEGRPVGFRIYAIRPDSLLGRLGFENGDRLERVNGLGLTSPDRALAAYARLREARYVRVLLRRNGAPLQLAYEIVD